MLPKQSKFNLRNDKNFFSDCKKKHFQYLSFFYKTNEGSGLRVSVIIPKKNIKLATLRNQIKRKIYSYIEKNTSKLMSKNLDLVIVLNKKNIEITDSDLKKAIEGNLNEIAE